MEQQLGRIYLLAILTLDGRISGQLFPQLFSSLTAATRPLLVVTKLWSLTLNVEVRNYKIEWYTKAIDL